MRRVGRSMTAGTAVTLALSLSPLAIPGVAAADDDPPQPQQHNVTYRARVDGVARGALITYRINDTQVNTADPTMLPGRTFEATGILTDPKEAGMRVSIQWPYSANLHCEILVDDQLVVEASQFIGPRLTPARDDPDYGAMVCGAPLSNAMGAPATPDHVPPDPMAPGEAPPLDSLPGPVAPLPDPGLPVT